MLPGALDSDRLARFTREALVLAALNHHNIAAAYGIEDRAIVMELVEGVELSGPAPLETALNYAGQIADGLAEGVFESERFGHVKGAFTDAKLDRLGRFELADTGTLFLDEIANVPISLQSKLLRVFEIGGNRFRQDLLFRLNTIEIHIPPLRERKEDIPHLASYFLAVLALRANRESSGRLEEVEEVLTKKALAKNDGNASHAARVLGLSRSALYRRPERYGI